MTTKTETFKTKTISNGRLTIPELTRELLNINDGDIVTVTIKKEV